MSHILEPWTLHDRQVDGKRVLFVTSSSGHCLNAIDPAEGLSGSMHGDGKPISPDELVAAFRLMAAAPGMLMCCEKILGQLRDVDQIHRRVYGKPSPSMTEMIDELQRTIGAALGSPVRAA